MVLIDSMLEVNRAYATKLASTTEIFFQLAQSQLHYSARLLGENFDDPALPLWQLARKARQMDASGVSGEIGAIRTWYFEAAQVKRELLSCIGLVQDKIGRLRSEVQTDPLTQLLNRRGLRAVLDLYQALHQPFAVLALDIDHFKRVNDSWGHDVGDRVIQQVAQTLSVSALQSDVVCRNGGEEFLMLLPLTSVEEACRIAERVRVAVADTPIKEVGNITLSVGVAAWQGEAASLESSLKQADDVLYRAEHAGRNRVVVAGEATALSGDVLA
ncbi:Stalked cell differentiation-controlling protein|nr:Stalked cell differentiation-controlling protein [Candidatus Pantoea persica]